MPDNKRASAAPAASLAPRPERDRRAARKGLSAVLFIDFQNDFCHAEGAAGRLGCDLQGVRTAVANATRLLAGCREAGILAVHSRHVAEKNGLSDSPAWSSFTDRFGNGAVTIRGTWGGQHLTELAPRETEPVVEKYRSSAFHGTNLLNLLRVRGIEQVTVCGVLAEGCVEATVRDALHNDFFVSVVTDATASHKPEVFEAYLTITRARYDTYTTDEFIEQIRSPRVASPKFAGQEQR